jgi:nucleotide-binding universal stress UspA family protein
MFKKILVCSDGSACALSAAKMGAMIAAHFGAEAIVLNILDYSLAVSDYIGAMTLAVDQNIIDDCAHAVRERLEAEALPLFAQRGVACRLMQEGGHPAEGALRVAGRENVDLIVVGSRRLRGVKELLLGSVSNGILHHAHCPVLLARGKNLPDPNQGFRHILLSSDGSRCAAYSTHIAVEMAQKFATSLNVLNVFADFPALFDVPPDADETLSDFDPVRYARHLFDNVKQATQEAAKDTGVYCEFHQVEGDPAAETVAFAQKHASDLIVMGSRGLGGFEQMLLGSVSNKVAHTADCPVLIAR